MANMKAMMWRPKHTDLYQWQLVCSLLINVRTVFMCASIAKGVFDTVVAGAAVSCSVVTLLNRWRAVFLALHGQHVCSIVSAIELPKVRLLRQQRLFLAT
jgi:hypothetical protein